jgi:hypothetical protein
LVRSAELPWKSLVPRIDKWNAGVCEIGDIARHDDFAVNRRRRCDQPVDHTARALRSQPAPFERDAITDRQDPVTVVLPRLFQPRGQSCGGKGIMRSLSAIPFMISPSVMTLR